VVLTSGGRAGRRLLAALEGCGAHAVVVYAPAYAREWRARPPSRRALWAPRVAQSWLRWQLRTRLDPGPRRAAGRVVVTGPLNGARMRRDLARLEPDVVVLAGCGLVSAEVIAVPREAVAGVHPGLLPWVRGNSPFVQSLLDGVPLGASAFLVDEGIDTGRLLARRLLPVAPGASQEALLEGLVGLWAAMTADLVRAAVAGPLGPGTPQGRRVRLRRDLNDPARLREAFDLLRAGRARELFEAWRPLCDPQDLSLPPLAAPEPVAPEPVAR
jgi:methionyl-tRNA formyltransferase